MPETKTVDTLTLKVAEALSGDVGRGIARLDPKDMAALGVEAGDIIGIVGKRATAVKVMPAFMEDREKGIVQIDAITRGNAQIPLDEKAPVGKVVDYKTATEVFFVPVTTARALNEKDIGYISKLLEGLPVTVGDRVRATLFGTRFQDFTVSDTVPKGVAIMHSITKIRIQSEGAQKRDGISYADIGGLHQEIQRIREMIELPLRYPEVFGRLGIEAPKGVLLYGPPGCGKTLIARAVVNKTSSFFIHISAPEIVHKFYGESEAHLRAIFEEAGAQAPSIVFIDEIDAIASRREEARSDQQVERRVVAQLLSLLDGLKSRGEVVVIGATNIPDVLDPALRRPGRFDREIAIGIPNKEARLEILRIHTKEMPLAADVDLEKIAEITHGFTGADLAALGREAGMITLRKLMPKLEVGASSVPYELLIALEVTMDDFLSAMNDVGASVIREVSTEIPDVSWDDVGGLDDAKRTLRECIEWPLKYPELFDHMKTAPPRGVLLYGVPGTGKTFLAKAVASESKVNFISVKGPALLSKWRGEADRGIREVFKRAQQANPCIIFLDELDAIAPIRGAAGADSHIAERVISQLMTEMDGMEELKGVFVLAATNRLDMIDPALLRAGRFDLQLELPSPDAKARLEIFSIHTKGKPLTADVDLKALADSTDGLMGADIEAICRRASMLAIRQFINKQQTVKSKTQKVNFSKAKISNKHFTAAISELAKQR